MGPCRASSPRQDGRHVCGHAKEVEVQDGIRREQEKVEQTTQIKGFWDKSATDEDSGCGVRIRAIDRESGSQCANFASPFVMFCDIGGN